MSLSKREQSHLRLQWAYFNRTNAAINRCGHDRSAWPEAEIEKLRLLSARIDFLEDVEGHPSRLLGLFTKNPIQPMKDEDY
jgi:hypothetical protein